MLIIALALAALFLYLALRNVNWAAFIQIIKSGHYQYLPLIILAASVSYFIRSQRWRVLLSAEKEIPRLQVFWATMIGYAGNAYLPARAGEILRSVMLAKKSQISISFVLATALTERLIDVVVLVLVSAAALLTMPEVPPTLRLASQGMAVVGLAGLLFLFVTPALQPWLVRILNWLPLNSQLTARLTGILEQFLQGMRALQNWRRGIVFMTLTAVIWLADGLISMSIAAMLNQQLTLPQALLLLAGLGLSSAIPSTPGYVGVFQFVAVTVLAPFGYSPSEALAFILVSQAINYIVVSFWGILGLLMFRDIKR
jgi:glycosyltransferase 2 family protein